MNRDLQTAGDQPASPTNWSPAPFVVEVRPPLTDIGVNDCSAIPGEARDTSVDNRAAPFFPFRECTRMDFAELDEGRLTFGNPQATDRCVERVSSYEAWTFERVAFTAEIEAILAEHPASLL